MSRLKVNTTIIRDYTWDGKPLDSLTRDELLEAVKVLGLEGEYRNPLQSKMIGRAIAGGQPQNDMQQAIAAQAAFARRQQSP